MYEAEELQAAEQMGLLHPEGDRPNRRTVTFKIIEVLTANHKDDANAAIIEDLTQEVFGYVGDNLRSMVASLCTQRGPVQGNLNHGGLVLCSTVKRVPVTINGHQGFRNIGARYVTTEADSILDDAAIPAMRRAKVAVANNVKFLDLALKRQPLLAAKLRDLRVLSHAEIRELLLPEWTQQPDNTSQP